MEPVPLLQPRAGRSLRRRAHEILDGRGPERGQLGLLIDGALISLIAANIVAVVLNSVESLAAGGEALFRNFELISVGIFTAEFLLRIWIAAENAGPGHSEWRARAEYLMSPLALADLVAIAPFYFYAVFHADLRFFRILRLLRVLKLTRYSSALAGFVRVLHMQRAALATSFGLLLLVMIFASSAMYVVENAAQPEAFSSIPAAMWWAVCTLTTVGYGDITPITPLGKVVAAGITIIGIGTVALPTSILASGFAQVHRRGQQELEAEANRALEDGIVSDGEARAYTALARRLGIDTDEAAEILVLAQRAIPPREPLDCPHCGKATA